MADPFETGSATEEVMEAAVELEDTEEVAEVVNTAPPPTARASPAVVDVEEEEDRSPPKYITNVIYIFVLHLIFLCFFHNF